MRLSDVFVYLENNIDEADRSSRECRKITNKDFINGVYKTRQHFRESKIYKNKIDEVL